MAMMSESGLQDSCLLPMPHQKPAMQQQQQ
jgi:hypothetical protein